MITLFVQILIFTRTEVKNQILDYLYFGQAFVRNFEGLNTSQDPNDKKRGIKNQLHFLDTKNVPEQFLEIQGDLLRARLF